MHHESANDVPLIPAYAGDISKISNGMTDDSVIAICGAPVVIHTLSVEDSGKNRIELWEYSGNKILMLLNDTVIEIIENKKATLELLANSKDSILVARHLTINDDSIIK